MQSGTHSSGPSSPPAPSTFWRKCTTCKKPIGFSQKYWVCSVSTCNRQRTGLVFCDIRCFDAHVPVLNHRDAGAFERLAPTQAQAQAALSSAEAVTTSKPASSGMGPQSKAIAPSTGPKANLNDEILVVVSKVKNYIRARSGMNTSDSVMDTLSGFVRKYSDQAIQSAERNGRKTVLDRDF
jgi:hypothetical protein